MKKRQSWSKASAIARAEAHTARVGESTVIIFDSQERNYSWAPQRDWEILKAGVEWLVLVRVIHYDEELT